MKRNEALLHLSQIINKCNELNLPCEPAIRHYGDCINEMVDNVMTVIQRMIDKPYNRCCRMQLVIDFEKMTDADYWTSSRIFCLLSKERSDELKNKLETMTDMLRALYLKMKQIDIDYAEKLLKRMEARFHKKQHIFDYQLWKIDHPDYTLDMLLDKEVELTSELLLKGVLAYDEVPKAEELEAVRVDLVQKHRKCNDQLPDNFKVECAKLRRYSYWDGQYLFMIDYPRIYRYLFMNCFEKFSNKQRMALYEYDMQLQMIHQDIKMLMDKELPTENEAANPKPDEEPFKFFHPSVSDEEIWQIHNEVKRLVTNYKVPDICDYLYKMASADDKKILLPQLSSVAYEELVRMGMPTTAGYSEKNFNKYYRYK